MQNFIFKFSNGEPATGSFTLAPVSFVKSSGSYIVNGNRFSSSNAPASFDLVPNVWKVEYNDPQNSNTWFISSSADTITASSAIVSGSYSTGSLCQVTFNVIDGKRSFDAYKTMSIKPAATNVGFNDWFALTDTLYYVTDQSGSLVVNLVPQAYTVHYYNDFKSKPYKYTILVPASASVYASQCLANDYKVSPIVTPQNRGTFGPTYDVADQRYAFKNQQFTSSISSSFATNAINAQTASTLIGNVPTASFSFNTVSASAALTSISASTAFNTISASTAFNSVTASRALTAISASWAPNQFSLSTGSNYPVTTSWANISQTASVAASINFVPATSSFAFSASFAPNQFALSTGSTYPVTASWSNNATTATVATSINFTPTVSVSASYASRSLSASFAPIDPAYSASLATVKQDKLITGNTYTITASFAINAATASAINFVPSVAISASFASASITASNASYAKTSFVEDINNGLVVYLPFNEGTGSVIRNYSSYVTDAMKWEVSNGNVTTVTGSGWNARSRRGGYSQLLTGGINGSASYIEMNDSVIGAGLANMSWAIWYQSSGSKTNNGRIVTKLNGGTAGEFSYSVLENSSISFFLVNSLLQRVDYTVNTPKLNDDKWHHIAAVYDSSASFASIYVDGKFCGGGFQSGSFNNTVWRLRVGTFENLGLSPLIGYVDEFKLWNRALSATEIMYLYNDGNLENSIYTDANGNSTVSGSTLFLAGATGSLQGTASWAGNSVTASSINFVPATSSYAVNATNAITAAFANGLTFTPTTASYAPNAGTASFVTASNVKGAISTSSLAVTASYLNGNASGDTATFNHITASVNIQVGAGGVYLRDTANDTYNQLTGDDNTLSWQVGTIVAGGGTQVGTLGVWDAASGIYRYIIGEDGGIQIPNGDLFHAVGDAEVDGNLSSNGNFLFNNATGSGLKVNLISGSANLRLSSGNNTIEMQNSSSAQTFNVYQTSGSNVNYKRLSLHSNGNDMLLDMNSTGSPSSGGDLIIQQSANHSVKIATNGTVRWTVGATGDLLPGASTYNIGQAGQPVNNILATTVSASSMTASNFFGTASIATSARSLIATNNSSIVYDSGENAWIANVALDLATGGIYDGENGVPAIQVNGDGHLLKNVNGLDVLDFTGPNQLLGDWSGSITHADTASFLSAITSSATAPTNTASSAGWLNINVHGVACWIPFYR